jgi:hypothetical protein
MCSALLRRGNFGWGNYTYLLHHSEVIGLAPMFYDLGGMPNNSPVCVP